MSLLLRAAVAVSCGLVAVTAASRAAHAQLALSPFYTFHSAGALALMGAVVLAGIGRHHPFPRLGLANVVTLIRAVVTALIVGATPESPGVALGWAVIGVAALGVVLDGVDGWAARRQQLASAFGARFDMEVDALLIMALAVLVWRFEKAGAWVLASGLLRYAFVAAAWVWPWFDRPLLPSRRRQAVCVVQIAGLVGALAPVVVPPSSTALAAGSLALLAWSFWVDVRWLVRHRSDA